MSPLYWQHPSQKNYKRYSALVLCHVQTTCTLVEYYFTSQNHGVLVEKNSIVLKDGKYPMHYLDHIVVHTVKKRTGMSTAKEAHLQEPTDTEDSYIFHDF